MALLSFDGLEITELKDLLREADLPVSGKKAELIARLEEADANAHAEVGEASEEVEEKEFVDFDPGVRVSWMEFRDIIRTLYDSMHRNIFFNSGSSRIQYLDHYVHGFSESAKKYPEHLKNYLQRSAAYDHKETGGHLRWKEWKQLPKSKKDEYEKRDDSKPARLSDFIAFLEDLSIDDGSINPWLVPAQFPSNGCTNPKLETEIVVDEDLENHPLHTSDYPLPMSEILYRSLFSPEHHSCRTCIRDFNDSDEDVLHVVNKSKYVPSSCNVRPNLADTESGFSVELSSSLRGLLRINCITLSGKMKGQFIRLARIRSIPNIEKLRFELDGAGPLDISRVLLDFKADIEPALGTEEILVRHGYRTQLARRPKSKLNQITPKDKFNVVSRLLGEVRSVCDPRRHDTVGSLFTENSTSIAGSPSWPVLYMLCDSQFLEEIRNVVASLQGDSANLRDIPILHQQKPGHHVTVSIDPIVFWK